MPEKRHEGWKNFATWGVALVIDNSPSWSKAAIRMAQAAERKMTHRSYLADSLREWIEDRVEIIPNASATQSVMRAQLIQAALNEVDWTELADHYLNKAKEGA